MAGSQPPAEEYRSVARIYTLISEFTTPILIGLVVDWQFGVLPWGLLIGTFVGLAMGGLGVMKLIRQMDAADARAKGRKP